LQVSKVECPTCGGSGVVDSSGSAFDDETLRDRDQTASDQDQTWSDHDQTASERDQRSADEDQQASDEDFAAGSDPVVHERTTSARERSSRDRGDVARLRGQTSDERFGTGDERDQSAELRDRGAEARDREARFQDEHSDAGASQADIVLRAERDRARAAADRARAAEDRSRAAADRKAASDQRAEAQRAAAEAKHTLELAGRDELTGARARKAGLDEVAREIERARRTGTKLTLAFIDVDHLKEVNDTRGHPAGDELLHEVVETVKAHVRSYDVIVRYGGDEFLCAMPNLTKAGAKRRLNRITALLAAANEGHSISFGLAECEPEDGVREVVSRADQDLLKTRRSRAVS
jgi:diguanylate cyclase (GGDEF)-like protein